MATSKNDEAAPVPVWGAPSGPWWEVTTERSIGASSYRTVHRVEAADEDAARTAVVDSAQEYDGGSVVDVRKA